ncbi:hypothetical protein FGO68_gene17672 [Halteria grandinella]|uniref:Cadherin domain-containing protein n=1 Tax=Halteria grandinella TaxID=5974 RepID=A0A8J8P793_HALGN|nr:hypothetical protein FGO68_gene17672 [Halteria grandinella]
MKYNVLTLIFLICLLEGTWGQSMNCNRAPFPLVLSTTLQVIIPSIEYHAASDQLVVIGRTSDQAFRGDAYGNVELPIAFLHSGPDKVYIWGKALYLGSGPISLESANFNGDGSIVVILSREGNKIVSVRSSDGYLLFVKQYETGTVGNVINWLQESIIVNSANPPSIFLMIRYCTTSCAGGFRIHSSPALSATTSTWAWRSSTTAATDVAMGIAFGETESVLYTYSYLSGGHKIVRLDAATGVLEWVYGFTSCGFTGNSNIEIKVSGGSHTLVVTSGSATSTCYVRMIIPNGGVGTISGQDQLRDSTTTGLTTKALFIQDQDTAYGVYSGTYSSLSLQTVLAKVDFINAKISYKQTLPQQAISPGLIKFGATYDVFYVPDRGQKVYTAPPSTATYFNVHPTQSTNSILYSSDNSKACYGLFNLGFGSPVSMVQTLNAVTQGLLVVNTSPYVPDSITFSEYVVTSSNYRDLVLSLSANQDSTCTYNLGASRILFSITPVTQASTTFQAHVGTAQTFTITPFQASIACGVTPPIFTYKGTTEQALPLSSFMSVDSSTGAISITNAAIRGTYKVLVTGVLQSTQKVTQVFTLQINTPPKFATAPVDVTLAIESSLTLTLPSVVDPDDSATHTIITHEQGQLILPSFVTYSSGTYSLTPTGISDIGIWTIVVELSDGIISTPVLYLFTITVTNSAPYFLISGPTTQSLNIGQTSTYPLPGFTDAETPVGLTVTFSQIPTFVSFAMGTFTINPTSSSNQGTHSVSGVISDGQLALPFSFDIIALNTAPYFIISSPVEQRAELSKSQAYTLPSYTDAETPLSVTLSISTIPSFVIFSGGIFTIYPMDQQRDIGTFPVQGLLSDGALTTPFSFDIVVVNPYQNSPIPSFEGQIQSLSNLGPPLFNEELPAQIEILTPAKYILTLPSISDPDDDLFSVNVDLGQSSTFSSLQSDKIAFQPTSLNVRPSPYLITITLRDQNTILQKEQTYKLNVLVTQAKQEPQQDTKNETVNSTNAVIDYGDPTQTNENTTNQTSSNQVSGIKIIKIITYHPAYLKIRQITQTGIVYIRIRSEGPASKIVQNIQENQIQVNLLKVDESIERVKFYIIDRDSTLMIINCSCNSKIQKLYQLDLQVSLKL